ncbi:MFS transporter [Megamonas funiformis]|jgi:lactose/raffinose/galactose permease|uniref:Sugar (Glycoside-Pentoside-Hexuronide) transporter n=2 Tax=Megamonas funiformis YIT 11815 TaxID=742816 RepID=A0ABP2NKS3_9FIRM|nr:glycoside-pentoside-hexuronide (GPH):cation symporter [Megamonas funiformis]EHR38007.1 sugar (Glycoside-Pentoside-Hexuronide) transporter [Megamonas funiformis YIT 11815]MBS7212335.1 glycoside-pentoside-hexuronide (GPH):cation symporter [Megamonas funiformis]QIB59791.1 MFS transporter [Megamonas funiformis]RGJ99966.1 MFS transporter [Megamonas funiformis]RGW42065.1 MFS transporter [Megamonas funiformis]
MSGNNGNKLMQRISYACGTFGHDIFYMMVSTYFIMFITSNLFNTEDQSHNEYMIGIIMTVILVIRVAELFIDPFIGNTIDKTNTRWGRFKPWVIVGGFVAALSLAILFTDLGGLTTSNPLLYLIIFAILYLVMDIFYSAKDVAIWSMVPAMSFDSKEREITATFARIGSVFGAQLVTVMVIPIVLFFSKDANGGVGDANGWLAFALIGGGVSLLGAVILGLGTKEQASALRENKKETTFKEVFSILGKNDQLMWIAITFLIFCFGQDLVNSFQMYYFAYILGDSTYLSFLGIINVIIGLLAVALFPVLTTKFKRRNLFFYSVVIMIIALIIYAFAGTNSVLVLIAAGLFNLPQPLVFLVVLMTITDTVEYGQLKIGHRDESLILSIRPLVNKLSGAVTSAIVGFTAVWVGMSGKATADSITDSNKMMFELIMFAVPIVFMLIATLLYKTKVTLTEEKHAEIVKELERTWKDISK